MAGLGGKQVLIVEDEQILAFDYATALAIGGAAILGPAVSCSTALEILHRHRVDAVVLDTRLSDRDCYPVAEYLHDMRIPFMFVSGYEHSVVRKAFARRPFLAKPFNGAQLVAAIELLVS